ncbi:MAG: AAA family ATPase [Burkholderiaceae bacterium]
MTLPTPERLRALLPPLEDGLLERDTAARLVLLAALAGEHVLLIGPPGTAKSELARRLHRAFDGAGYFERLLTRFSTPEELFGPLSLKALEDDRYERLTAGFLPTAGIAFLDEVFKANSAILNALLTLLNEREFDNGSGRVATPLVSVVGASNELPADEALQAFLDRFLLRVPVGPVSDAAFAALLRLPPAEPTRSATSPLTLAERQAIAPAAVAIPLGESALAACARLRAWLAARGQALSDRRWRQWMGLMRTAAATEGRTEVDTLDLWLAPHVAGAAAADVDAVAAWFETELLGAVPQAFEWLTRAVEAFEQQLNVELSAQAEGAEGDGSAGKLALARSIGRPGGEAGTDTSMPRLVLSGLEAQLQRRYSPVHLGARVAQVDDLIAHALGHRQGLAAEADDLALRLQARWWLPPSRAARWTGAHAESLARLDALLARLGQARAGFAALPVDEALPAVAPVPVAVPEVPAEASAA